ncbi:MAG: M20 family metallopeptidase [Planctomycetota bacterium]|nr:M20 family metallopeptidase [Planctomycetota bacterium]MDA1179454.1 M20 family metallopeptidase [Planctomycetota bacterium]
MNVIPRLLDLHPEMTAWRHALHAHPQTAFEETFASEFVATKLESWGIPTQRGIAKTGVVGTIHGDLSHDGQPGFRIGLRADMDALDIQELNDVPYRSTFPGKMHACGHDGHTTMLLGAARYLAETRQFAGTVHVIFQPAEENEGGGRVMLEEGLLVRFPCDAVFGMHNWPGVAVGAFAVCDGPIMAAFDVFEIKVVGHGCHAAMPHIGVDPIVGAAQIVGALQTIASRNVSPLEQVVLSVTQIHGGETWNVIPGEVVLRGTVRTFQSHVQDKVEARMRQVVTGVAEGLGCVATIDYQRRYPATVNTSWETNFAASVAANICGAVNVDTKAIPCMGSEDFSFMLQQCPGCYIWAGNGDGVGVHNARYDFNDQLLPIGASYWARIAETYRRPTVAANA